MQVDPVYPVEHAKQVEDVVQDLHLVLITVQESHTPLLSKNPAEQSRQVTPWNPDEQTVQAVLTVH